MKSRICVYLSPCSEINSYFEMIDIAAEYGLNLETLGIYELKTPDFEVAKRLREYADKKGVEFPCVSVGVNLVGSDAREKIEIAKRYAQVANILGSPYLHHTIATGSFTEEDLLDNHDLYVEKGLQAVREVYDYAADLGVKTALEPTGKIFNGIAGIKLIEGANRDTKVVADFGNVEALDENIVDFIPAFADKIVHVHVKDYKRVSKGNYQEEKDTYKTKNGSALYTRMLGEGDIDFDKAFLALDKIGYKGAFSIECPHELFENGRKLFEQNIEFLKKYYD